MRLNTLRSLFVRADLEQIVTRTIDVKLSFATFDDLWRAHTPSFNPLTKAVAALTLADRSRLIDAVRASLPAGPDGRVAHSVRAHGIKARISA